MRIAIIGSYVIKSACNLLDREIVQVSLYAPRISMASFSDWCPSVTAEEIADCKLDSFAQSVVSRDINKSIFSEIELSKPDVVMVDFLDDHFDYIVHRETRSVITRSNYLSRCDFKSFVSNEWEIVERTSDIGWDLWLKGSKRFLDAVGKEKKIVLIKNFQPEHYIDNGEIKAYSKNILDRIRRRNAVISRSCEMFEIISRCQIVEPPVECFVSKTSETYGVNPSNLPVEVFSTIASAVKNITLRSSFHEKEGIRQEVETKKACVFDGIN